VSEADIALVADRLSSAVSGLRELIGEDQLDVRARISGVEERLGILEHLVGQLVAQQSSTAAGGSPVGGKKVKGERRRSLSQRPIREPGRRKKAAAEDDPIAASSSMDRGPAQGLDLPQEPDDQGVAERPLAD
jgi:hypothetical protein